MKLQYLAVIFVIIIIPISLVMSQYIQTQIDTIVLQTSCTSNLNNATHDALKAFQINSINNKYSSLSDSKIRDIEASINTFYNSLGTSMEKYISSKEELSVFVPAIVFTLYDGYYIHSSYNNYTPTEQGKANIVNQKQYQDGLRPYIYYSCKYKLKNGKIVIVNYTLDNAITVYGDVGDGKGYQTRSGYLINPNDVNNVNNGNKTLRYKGIEIGPETLTEHLITIENEETGATSGADYNYIIYNNKKVYKDNNSNRYFWYDNYKKTYLESEATNVQRYINTNGVGFRSISAFEYYRDAKSFSEWVNQNLGDITQADVVEMSTGETTIGSNTNYLSVNTGTSKIFDTTGSNNNPLISSSIFNSHRMAVIRKSIETNLTTAIANYNIQSGSNFEFSMPVINEEDWGKILNNVSVISFMQGIPIGQKYFNNYSVITNTKNEEVINEQSVYVLIEQGNSLEYHQPGCKELIDKVKGGANIVGAYTSLSFQRQTVKKTESTFEYFYPQTRNGKITTGCYNCIVNATGNYDIDSIISGQIKNYQTGQVIYNENDLARVRKAYLTALARERYDLYKSNFDLK